MDLVSSSHGLTTVISIGESRIDAACAVQFKDAMRKVLNDAGTRVILDLKPVQFIDSSGLGAIVAVMKSMADEQSLELASLTPTVEKVFSLTRLDTVFPIHTSADAAIHAG